LLFSFVLYTFFAKVDTHELGFYPLLVLYSQCWGWGGRMVGDDLTVVVGTGEGVFTGKR
jgi:hypothetical protein